MEIDFTAIGEHERYKLMSSLIVPRPVALVTTLNPGHVINAAPFSMFNMVGEEPPLVMLSINRLRDGHLKDTAANILAHGEFVVHIADEPMAQAMDRCSEPLPPEASEIDLAGLHTCASTHVAPPRIAEAPVAFECQLHEHMETDSRYVFFGRVLCLHAREGLIDTQRWHVRLQDYFPVGRFGGSLYVNTRGRFTIEASKDAACCEKA